MAGTARSTGRFSAVLASASGASAVAAAVPEGAGRFQPGEVVNGHFLDDQWYLATVESDNGDGTFSVAWFDGDTSNRVKRWDELTLMRYDPELRSYIEAPVQPALPVPVQPAVSGKGDQECHSRPAEEAELLQPQSQPQAEPGIEEPGRETAAGQAAREHQRLSRRAHVSRAAAREPQKAMQPDPRNKVRLNFSVSERMLPVKRPTMRLPGGFRPAVEKRYEEMMCMFVERDGMTPEEVAQIWEAEWNVGYASRIKFAAPRQGGAADGEERRAKYLHPRFDTVPSHPAVIPLEGVSSIIISLVARLREHDPQFAEQPVAAPGQEVAPEERKVRQEMRAEAQRREMELTLGGRQRQTDAAMRRLAALSGGSFTAAPATVPAPAGRRAGAAVRPAGEGRGAHAQEVPPAASEKPPAASHTHLASAVEEPQPSSSQVEMGPDAVEENRVRVEGEDHLELDDEERQALAEVSKKGYYHNRPRNADVENLPQRIKGGSAGKEQVRRVDFDEYQKKWDRFDDDNFVDELEA